MKRERGEEEEEAWAGGRRPGPGAGDCEVLCGCPSVEAALSLPLIPALCLGGCLGSEWWRFPPSVVS